MRAWRVVPLVVGLIGAAMLGGCGTLVGGAAGGAAGYEYSNKRALDQLDKDYKEGKITKEEYNQRREEIDKRSVIE